MDSILVNRFMNAGLSFIPVDEHKRPQVDGWKEYQTRRPDPDEISSMDFLFSHGVAIICGDVSGGVEVIDVDVKNDPTGRIWDEFRHKLQEQNPYLYSKVITQRTMSGGYHIIYRCPSPGRNEKLAWHEDENGSRKEIIETRGNGGYILAWPTPKYEVVIGSLPNIPMITQEERDELLAIARSLDRTTVKMYSNNTALSEKSSGARATALRAVTVIAQKRLNIAVSYEDWLNAGLALADEFQEEGRELFHTISQFDHRYDPQNVDFHYDKYLQRTKDGITGKTIKTFLAICKRNGIDTRDEPGEDMSRDAKLLDWVEKQSLKYNVCTGKIHLTETQELNDQWENELWYRCRADLKASIGFDMFKRAITKTGSLEEWNPIQDYLNGLQFWDFKGDPIEDFLDTIDYKDDRMRVFVKKWLLSLIATAYGDPQEIVLVLIGPQGLGKTEFFTRLLPPALRKYCVIDQLDQEKDSEILMCSNLIVVDDEWEGKSKKRVGHFKSMTTKKVFQIRHAYARHFETRPRLCMFAGCSNQSYILNDTTGNRRILPVEANGRDFEKSDAIDRNDLFAALVQEYFRIANEEGYRLTSEETDVLFERSDEFQLDNPAKVAIATTWSPCEKNDPLAEKKTVNDMVKVLMENNPYLRIDTRQLGVEAVQMGFKKWRTGNARGYYVKEKVDDSLPDFDDAPF